MKLKPYNYPQLNNMDSWSMVVSAVTIYSGLYFMTKQLNESFKLMFFILMVLANIFFLVYWIYYTFGYYIGKCLVRIGCCKGKFGKDEWINRIVPDLNFSTEIKDVNLDKEPGKASMDKFSVDCKNDYSKEVSDKATADATMDMIHTVEKSKKLKLQWVKNLDNS